MGSHAGWCCVPAGCNDHIQRSCRCSAADRRRRERSGCMRTTLCGSRTHRTRLSRSRPPRTPRPTHCAHGAACDAGAGARPCPARGGMSSWVLSARASLRLRSFAPLRGAARVKERASGGDVSDAREGAPRASSFGRPVQGSRCGERTTCVTRCVCVLNLVIRQHRTLQRTTYTVAVRPGPVHATADLRLFGSRRLSTSSYRWY